MLKHRVAEPLVQLETISIFIQAIQGYKKISPAVSPQCGCESVEKKQHDV